MLALDRVRLGLTRVICVAGVADSTVRWGFFAPGTQSGNLINGPSLD